MRNFIVQLELQSPIIIGRRLTLDALLAGILYKQDRDAEAAIRHVRTAIAHIGGVPQASQALLHSLDMPVIEDVAILQSTSRGVSQMVLPILDPVPAKIELGRGPYQNLMNTYRVFTTQYVYFLARGEPDFVVRVLRRAHAIGAQHTKGYGQLRGAAVLHFEFDAVPAERFAMVGNGFVLRPIPARLAAHFPPGRHGTIAETWQNPYLPLYGGTVEPCMVPPFMTGESFTGQQIAAFGHSV